MRSKQREVSADTIISIRINAAINNNNTIWVEWSTTALPLIDRLAVTTHYQLVVGDLRLLQPIAVVVLPHPPPRHRLQRHQIQRHISTGLSPQPLTLKLSMKHWLNTFINVSLIFRKFNINAIVVMLICLIHLAIYGLVNIFFPNFPILKNNVHFKTIHL